MLEKHLHKLTYDESTSEQAYTVKPQGVLNPVRLAQGRQDCWPKLTPSRIRQKKALILADWWAGSWDKITQTRVLALFAALLRENFVIYVWQAPDVMVFDNLMDLHDTDFLKKITPEYQQVIENRAIEQHKLTKDKLLIIQHKTLLELLDVPLAACTAIPDTYLVNNINNIAKIRAIEATEPSFDTVTAHDLAFYQHYKDDNVGFEGCAYETANYISEHITWWSPDLVFQAPRYQQFYLNGECERLSLTHGQHDSSDTPSLMIDETPLYLPILSLDLNCYSQSHEEDIEGGEDNEDGDDNETPPHLFDQCFSPDLKSLIIHDSSFHDEQSLRSFAKATCLEYFEWSGIPSSPVNQILSASQYTLVSASLHNFEINAASDIQLNQLISLKLVGFNVITMCALLERTPELTCLHIDAPQTLSLDAFILSRPLDKLKSIKLTGHCDAHFIPLLLAAAPNCEHLDLSGAKLSTIIPPMNLSWLISLRLGQNSANLLQHALQIRRLSIAYIPASMILERDYAFLKDSKLHNLDTLVINNCLLTTETLKLFINAQPHLKHLFIKARDATVLDCDDVGLFAGVENIRLDNVFLPGVGRLASVTVGYNHFVTDPEDRSYSPFVYETLIPFFQSTQVNELVIHDYVPPDDLGLQPLTPHLPDSIERLIVDCYQGEHDITVSVETLKALIRQLPNLNFLKITNRYFFTSDVVDYEDWFLDEELQSLISRIPDLILPYDYYEYQRSRIRKSMPTGCDGDTTFHKNKTFTLERIFYAASGNSPSPSRYRLEVYNGVSLTNYLSSYLNIEPFIYESSSDLQIVSTNVIQVFDWIPGQGPEDYFGKQTFLLTDLWEPIASLEPNESMTRYHLSNPRVQVEIGYSLRDNLYYIRGQKRAQMVVLDFAIVCTQQPQPVSCLISPLKELVTFFRSFRAKALQHTKKNPSAQDIIDAIIEQRVGACRHRAVAFKVLMEKRYPDYPVRIVNNHCHSFVEIKQGDDWIRCDLGGYPAKLNVIESIESMSREPGAPTIEQMDALSEKSHLRVERLFPKRQMDTQPQYVGADRNRLFDTSSRAKASASPETLSNGSVQTLDRSQPTVAATAQDVLFDETISDQIEVSPVNPVDQKSNHKLSDQDVLSDETIPDQMEVSPVNPVDQKSNHKLSEQKRTFERQFETWSAAPDISTSDSRIYFQRRLNAVYKKQLIQLGAEQIHVFNIALQSQALDAGHPVFYVHSPDDLVCSAPFIQREGHRGILCTQHGGGGVLHDFLTAPRDANEPDPVLIVNYNRFLADDIVRFNGLLDEKRHADGTPLPDNMLLIGLYDRNQPDAYTGADFYSRFDHVEQCPIRELPTVEPVFHPLPFESLDDLMDEHCQVINLCHASTWLTQLMGGWVLRHGELYFEPGELIHALTQDTSATIIIQNPPNDVAFDLFWQQARLRGAFDYAGVTYPFPSTWRLFTTQGYNWDKTANQFVSVAFDMSACDALILNPGTLSDFLSQYAFDAQGRFDKQAGFIEHHASQQTNEPLKLLVTRTLSEDAWGMVCHALETHRVNVHIACTPDVQVPAWLGSAPPPIDLDVVFDAWDKYASNQTTAILSEDPDITVLVIKTLHPDAWVFDISECDITDLIKRTHGRLENGAFVFSETTQAVFNALQNNQRVVLTGEFSEALLDNLALFLRTRLHANRPLGQLTIITKHPIAWLPQVQHAITLADKREALCSQGFTDNDIEALNAENPYYLENEGYITLLTRLRFKGQFPNQSSQDAWDGLYTLSLSKATQSLNLETSAIDAAAFFRERLHQVTHRLENEPFVFLAGLTGVGKSRFVENELMGRRVFHGENAMLAWIQASEDERPTLFLDEANLSSRQWSEFEGLYQQPPGLLYQGHYYPLSSSHRVIFAGNPLHYGDERKLAPLFTRHGNSLVFQPLPPAVLYETVLKPLLDAVFCPTDMALIAESLLAVYQFLVEASSREVLISPRQLQMMALSVIDYAQRFPHANLASVAQFQARHVAIGLVPQQFRPRFEETFPEIDRAALVNQQEEPIALNGFLPTPSRNKALWQLTDFLSLRDLQRRTAADENPAKRLGGLHRFVIEGEPGIGKSELVMQVMASREIHEARLNDSNPLDNAFYRISASMQPDIQTAILLRAFDTGSIVLIDEINSMPTLEKLLNSLLDGKHPKDNNRPPHRPGFRVLGTQNPPTMAGRRNASPALDNRTQTVRLDPYTSEEMNDIASTLGLLGSNTRDELINAFQSKSAEAKRKHLTPPPSFRDFIRAVSRLVKAQQDKQRENEAFLYEEMAPGLSLSLCLALDEDERDVLLYKQASVLSDRLDEYRLNRLVEIEPHCGKSWAFVLASSDEGIKLLYSNNYRLLRLIHPETLNHIIPSGAFAGTSVAFFIANSPKGDVLLSTGNFRLASRINKDSLNARAGAQSVYGGLSTGICLASSLEGKKVLYAENARLFGLLDTETKHTVMNNFSFSLVSHLLCRLKRDASELSNQDEVPADDQYRVKRRSV